MLGGHKKLVAAEYTKALWVGSGARFRIRVKG